MLRNCDYFELSNLQNNLQLIVLLVIYDLLGCVVPQALNLLHINCLWAGCTKNKSRNIMNNNIDSDNDKSMLNIHAKDEINRMLDCLLSKDSDCKKCKSCKSVDACCFLWKQ